MTAQFLYCLKLTNGMLKLTFEYLDDGSSFRVIFFNKEHVFYLTITDASDTDASKVTLTRFSLSNGLSGIVLRELNDAVKHIIPYLL